MQKIPLYCVSVGIVLGPLFSFWKVHMSQQMDMVCQTPVYQYTAKYYVAGVALASMLYYGVEMLKNITVRNEESTLHSLTNLDFFLKYPWTNLKLQDSITLQYAFAVYSYFWLLYSLITDDYATQFSYLVVDTIMFSIKVAISIASLVSGTIDKNDLLMDGLSLLVSGFIWSSLACNVHYHFGGCKALE